MRLLQEQNYRHFEDKLTYEQKKHHLESVKLLVQYKLMCPQDVARFEEIIQKTQ